MKKAIGLWIDHRKAVVVTISDEGDEGEEIKEIITEGGSSEDIGDRQIENHLNSFYDKVIAVIRDADSIHIFGPGEAKGELKKRLESKGLGECIVGVETVDKMTDPQIAAKVRELFPKK